jgi:hypothetical protein
MRIMKRLTVAILAIGISGVAIAEGPMTAATSNSEKMVVEKKGFPDRVNVIDVPDIVTSATMETNYVDFMKKLHEVQLLSASLLYDSKLTFFNGSYENLQSAAMLTERVTNNVVALLEHYAEKDPKAQKWIKGMNSTLGQLNAYHHGPNRDSFTIELVSNEGKGEMTLANGRKVRYAVGPGLTATPIDEREVHIVERLADGTHKIATGIMYRGQEQVTMNWDPRVFSLVTWYLDYHNITSSKNSDLFYWLQNGPLNSMPVAYSENKTAAKSAVLTGGRSIPSSVFKGVNSHLTTKAVSDCDCD